MCVCGIQSSRRNVTVLEGGESGIGELRGGSFAKKETTERDRAVEQKHKKHIQWDVANTAINEHGMNAIKEERSIKNGSETHSGDWNANVNSSYNLYK